MTTTHSANKSAWWELTLEVPASWAEDASASLIEAGALGVQAVDAVTEPLAAFAKATVQPRQHLPSRPGHALL
ncbi:MAG TPA: hypothetical protein VFH51_19860, partial [Myxococcota bacterium]|nr:hypothetical protein [Myxococcota bacterium]